jgi:uncharacterized protein YbjT (DUF2867 family)
VILVTGAGGKTGRAIIRALIAKGATVRALVHRPEQVTSIQDQGAQEIAVGDMRDQAVMEQAARRVRAIYHICPNVSPDEVAIGQVVIAAARAAGTERLVYHSVLHPQTEAMPHHWSKLRVEEQLFESGCLVQEFQARTSYEYTVQIYDLECLQDRDVAAGPVDNIDSTRLDLLGLSRADGEVLP